MPRSDLDSYLTVLVESASTIVEVWPKVNRLRRLAPTGDPAELACQDRDRPEREDELAQLEVLRAIAYVDQAVARLVSRLPSAEVTRQAVIVPMRRPVKECRDCGAIGAPDDQFRKGRCNRCSLRHRRASQAA